MASQSAIPEISTIGDLASLAGIELRVLTWLTWAIDDRDKYTTFSIKRRDGTDRTISAPIKPLKDAQQNIAKALLEAYRPPAHVHGFTKGRSPVSNAAIHVGKFHVFRADLSDFFPSITYRRVRGLFRAWPFEYPDDVSKALARICCHQDALPQGAPTSPIVSNFICRRMDRQLAQLAGKERCHFSRYADDLTFSTNQHQFPAGIGEVEGRKLAAGEELKRIVATNGFAINAEKTTLTRQIQRQRVTGIVVNEKLNLPREYVRSLRSLLYIWRTFKKPAAETAMAKHHPRSPNHPAEKPVASFEQVVRGRVQYVGSVKGFRNPTYSRLAKQLSEVDAGFRAPPKPVIQAAFFTEGPSDWRHLIAAQRHFHERGEFTDILLVAGSAPSKEGHSQLRKYAEKLGGEEQTEFSICIFDSDVKDARDAVGSDGWKRYGPRVLAIGLAAPEFRDDPAIFVESLYADEVLKTRLPDGRRLYLRGEFVPRTGHHKTEDCSIRGDGSKTFIQEKVHEFKTQKRLSLTKVEFAQAVLDDPSHFGDEIFDGFRPTFNRIQVALRESWDAVE